MPPKQVKRQSLNQQIPQPSSQENKLQQSFEELYINPKNIIENGKVVQRVRMLTSLLAGFLAGILNVNQLLGPCLYVGLHLIITLILTIVVKPVQDYFLHKSGIFSGVGSGILIFVCIWMIVYNVVYTL